MMVLGEGKSVDGPVLVGLCLISAGDGVVYGSHT